MLLHNYNQKYSKVLEYFSSTSPKSEYLLKYRKISKNGTRVPLVLEYHGTLSFTNVNSEMSIANVNFMKAEHCNCKFY